MELRAERHCLANEAMRSTAFQLKLTKVTSERDHLRIDLEVVRKALAKSAEEMAITVRKRDAQIAGLVIELVTVKEALVEAQRRAAEFNPSRRVNDETENEVAAQIRVLEGSGTEAEEEISDITFSR